MKLQDAPLGSPLQDKLTDCVLIMAPLVKGELISRVTVTVFGLELPCATVISPELDNEKSKPAHDVLAVTVKEKLPDDAEAPPPDPLICKLL